MILGEVSGEQRGSDDAPPLVLVQDGPAVDVGVLRGKRKLVVDVYVVCGVFGWWGADRGASLQSERREGGETGQVRFVEETTTSGICGGGVVGAHVLGEIHGGCGQKGK